MSSTVRASIVVLTYNQLKDCTVPCIESVLRNTPEGEYELIIVDNASADGTAEYLRDIDSKYSHVAVVLNEENKGYAGGNNDGVRLSKGRSVILLNNDTLVAPGWLDALLRPMEEDATVGLIGPVSNSVGNEQRAVYNELKDKDFESFAAEYVARHGEATFTPDRLGFFCVGIRREVVESVGLLDEAFGVGMFEDDDYCLRAKAAGFGLLVTEGAFVYHKGSASFSQLGARQYSELFARNKAYFSEKHNRAWTLSDMALSFLDKFEADVACYKQSASPVDPAIERIDERFKMFRSLLVAVRDKEAQADAVLTSCDHTPPVDSRSRWAVRREVFRNEFLNGSKAQRKRYIKAVWSALW